MDALVLLPLDVWSYMLVEQLAMHGYTRETRKLFAFSKRLRMATLGSLDWWADVAYPRLVTKLCLLPRPEFPVRPNCQEAWRLNCKNLLGLSVDIVRWFNAPVPYCTMHALYASATLQTLMDIAEYRTAYGYDASSAPLLTTSLIVYASRRHLEHTTDSDLYSTVDQCSLSTRAHHAYHESANAKTGAGPQCELYALRTADFSSPVIHSELVRWLLSAAYLTDRYDIAHEALYSQATPKERALDLLYHLFVMCVNRAYSPAFKQLLKNFLAAANITLADLTPDQRFDVLSWCRFKRRGQRDTTAAVVTNHKAVFEVLRECVVEAAAAAAAVGTTSAPTSASLTLLIDGLHTIADHNAQTAHKHLEHFFAVTAVIGETRAMLDAMRLRAANVEEQQEPKRKRTELIDAEDEQEVVPMCDQMHSN